MVCAVETEDCFNGKCSQCPKGHLMNILMDRTDIDLDDDCSWIIWKKVNNKFDLQHMTRSIDSLVTESTRDGLQFCFTHIPIGNSVITSRNFEADRASILSSSLKSISRWTMHSCVNVKSNKDSSVSIKWQSSQFIWPSDNSICDTLRWGCGQWLQPSWTTQAEWRDLRGLGLLEGESHTITAYRMMIT